MIIKLTSKTIDQLNFATKPDTYQVVTHLVKIQSHPEPIDQNSTFEYTHPQKTLLLKFQEIQQQHKQKD